MNDDGEVTRITPDQRTRVEQVIAKLEGNNILDRPCRGVIVTPPRWGRPGRLFSLWELMKHLRCEVLLSVATAIQYYADAEYHNGVEGGDLTPEHRQEFLGAVAKWRDQLGDGLQVGATKDQVQRIKELLEAPEPIPHVRMMNLLNELNGRFLDDVGRCDMLYLPPRESELFSSMQSFGSRVYEAFPSAIDDIEEASKCLALGRGTATVFHLMRVMEAGLKAVARKMDIPYAPSWESYLKQIKDKLDENWKNKSRAWKKEEPFYSEVHSHLSAVKVAWRNPTMHIVKHYTPDTAEDIFNSVKGFMKHLATKLAEPKPRKRRR